MCNRGKLLKECALALQQIKMDRITYGLHSLLRSDACWTLDRVPKGVAVGNSLYWNVIGWEGCRGEWVCVCRGGGCEVIWYVVNISVLNSWIRVCSMTAAETAQCTGGLAWKTHAGTQPKVPGTSLWPTYVIGGCADTVGVRLRPSMDGSWQVPEKCVCLHVCVCVCVGWGALHYLLLLPAYNW